MQDYSTPPSGGAGSGDVPHGAAGRNAAGSPALARLVVEARIKCEVRRGGMAIDWKRVFAPALEPDICESFPPKAFRVRIIIQEHVRRSLLLLRFASGRLHEFVMLGADCDVIHICIVLFFTNMLWQKIVTENRKPIMP